MNESNDDFIADDFTPDTQDDFVADDFVPDQPAQQAQPDQPKKEERGPLAKAGRIATQVGLSAAELKALPYEIAVAPLNTEGYYENALREDIGEDLENLYMKKAYGKWTDKDEKELEYLQNRLQNPEAITEQAKGLKRDLSIRGLTEKATGTNLHPEGFLEKAASWLGFLKDPKKVGAAIKNGINPKELMRAIAPDAKEFRRVVGAATLWEMAEQGQFGPAGTIAAMIGGDLIGHGVTGLINIVKNPKQSLAQAVNFLTVNNTKKLAATQLADDFAKSGLQIDAGTLTGSPLVQMLQTRLSQSGLVGESLDNFRKDLSGQIVKEYEQIAEQVGELAFENSYQASEALKEALKVEVGDYVPRENLNAQKENAPRLQGRVQVAERPNYQQELLDNIAPQEVQNSYQGGENLKTAAEDIRAPLKEEFSQRFNEMTEQIQHLEHEPQAQLVRNLENFVESHQGSLLLGESTAEYRVFNTAQRLLENLRTEEGALRGVTVDQLIKTRRTLGDVANWEMAGSNFESAYKNLVSELNTAIDRTLIEHPELREQYLHLNADYEAYKNLFENKNLEKIYNPTNTNYNTIWNDFANDPDKLRALEDIFYQSERGTELINEVKRDYTQKVIEKPDLTPRDIRNLQSVLGPEYDHDLLNYYANRQQALEHPLPQAAEQNRLGLQVQAPQTKASQTLNPERISETGTEASKANLRKKYLKEIAGKSEEQVLKEMDTIAGIKKLRKVLNTTPEGQKLFKELSRFKLAQIIDNKMLNSASEQIKLGTFSKLLDNKATKEIVKELIGVEAFDKLELLQKNAGRLSESAAKFFNASKSGSVLADTGFAGSAVVGIFTGNPYIAVPAIATIGGGRVAAHLLADKVFLRELEKAIRAPSQKKFDKALKNMQPRVRNAIQADKKEQEKE